jgi:hypothetical protein
MPQARARCWVSADHGNEIALTASVKRIDQLWQQPCGKSFVASVEFNVRVHPHMVHYRLDRPELIVAALWDARPVVEIRPLVRRRSRTSPIFIRRLELLGIVFACPSLLRDRRRSQSLS